MNDPSIAVAMLGAGSRPARDAHAVVRGSWLDAVRDALAAWRSRIDRSAVRADQRRA